MSDTVFLSYHPNDGTRAGIIASALRAEGLQVSGDIAVPPGTPRRDVFGDALTEAWVIVSLWSRTAVNDAELAEEAAGALARGAYLGALIDGVRPPAAFADAPAIDLAGWGGARDRKLAELVDAVQARVRPAAPAPPPVFERRGKKSGLGRGAITAVVIAAIVAIGVAAILFTRSGQIDHAAEVRTRLAAIPCAWLQVDPVDNGTTGKLVLTGVADDPERAGEVIRGLVRGDSNPPLVTTDRVARIGSADCPAIDVPRTLRKDDGGRLRVTSDGIGVDKAMNLAEARVRLAFRPGDKAMALFGIEPSGKVTWVLPDFGALDAIEKEDVGFVRDGPRTTEFSLRSDHLGWTGLLLVTGDAPLAGNLPQGAVRDSAQFADFLTKATRTGDHQAEMVWYEIHPK